MSGFVLHPEAHKDLDEIWEYVAADNLDAADRVREGSQIRICARSRPRVQYKRDFEYPCN